MVRSTIWEEHECVERRCEAPIARLGGLFGPSPSLTPPARLSGAHTLNCVEGEAFPFCHLVFAASFRGIQGELFRLHEFSSIFDHGLTGTRACGVRSFGHVLAQRMQRACQKTHEGQNLVSSWSLHTDNHGQYLTSDFRVSLPPLPP